MISIRSYKRREGRMIPSRQRALDEFWLDYGVTEQGPLDLDALFGRQAPCHLEIGFGMGEALLEMARQHPENNYLGVDVYLPGVGQLLLGIREMGITNVRIDRRDAMEVLALLPAGSVRGVSLFFPDPWHKKRHHKRRIIKPAFIALVAQKLKTGGFFHMATDWQHYAEHMLEEMDDAESFHNISGEGNYSSSQGSRCETKFERRGLRLGHGVWDLIYEKQ